MFFLWKLRDYIQRRECTTFSAQGEMVIRLGQRSPTGQWRQRLIDADCFLYTLLFPAFKPLGHDTSIKNRDALAVWYHTLAVTGSRFWVATILHWAAYIWHCHINFIFVSHEQDNMPPCTSILNICVIAYIAYVTRCYDIYYTWVTYIVVGSHWFQPFFVLSLVGNM